MNISVVSSRLLQSFVLNGEIFIITLILGLPIGLLISLGSMSRFKPLAWLTKTFVWIVRGSPLMLQVIIVFYGPGLIWGAQAVGRMEATIAAFVINYACYFSEILRGGIEGIPTGQMEAGQVLGMTKFQIFFKVTLLQVVKRIVPPIGNEVMTLIKDTSLARVIANKEIIMMAQEYTAKGIIWPLFYTLVFFLIACGILTLLLGWFERKLSYFK